MKKILVAAGVLLLFSLYGCSLLGPSLPSELKGSWSHDNGYYKLTFTFEARHMYYSDYASNTGGSSSWDEEIVDVNTDECYFVTSYDCWSWHITGSTLYLIKESYSKTPDLPDSWWLDTSIAKYTLTKD